MPDFDDLDKLGNFDDLGNLDHISFDDPAPAAPARPASGLGTVIQDLMAHRNYQQVLQIAASQQDAVARDPAVAAMVQSARGKLEQEAFLQNFLDGARRAFAAGQIDQARQYYEKARALDPHHPDLIAFAREASAPPAAAAPAAAAYAPPAAPTYAPPAAAAYAPPAYAPPAAQDDLLSFDEPSFQIDPLGGGAAPAYGAPPAAAMPGYGAPPAGQEMSFGDLDFDESTFGSPNGSVGTPSSLGAGASFGGGGGASFGTEASFAPPSPGGPASFGTESSFDGLDGFENAFGSPNGAPAGSSAPAGPSVYEQGFGGGDGGGNRIGELLAEGQSYFDREEYQNAIDVWSRIFLIDIESQDASSRIEAARGKKAERERQAEELFHRASSEIERGSFEDAKNSLAQVLVLQPGHSSAKDYLEQLHAGKVPTIRREDPGALDLLDDGGFGDLQKAAGVKEVGHTLEAAVARDRVVVVKKADRRLIAAAAAGAVVVFGAIFFLVTRWDSLFPNAESGAAAVAPQKTGSIERAKKIFEQGHIENAIQLLDKVPPEDEGYKEAQTLITQWKAMVKSGTPEDAGPSPELTARRQRMVEAAREMHKQRQYLKARKLLERAHKIQPLDGADLALKQESDGKLESIAPQIALFNEGEYEQVLPQLWRLHDASPKDADILGLMLDSYYNLAISDLQKGAPDLASQKLKDAVGLQPGNEELIRLRLFADSYATRSQDLLYRIYVKYLPTRS